jgi:hypothetical protein
MVMSDKNKLEPIIGLGRLHPGDLVEIVGEGPGPDKPPVNLMGVYKSHDQVSALFDFQNKVEGRDGSFAISLFNDVSSIPYKGLFKQSFHPVGYRVIK